MSTKSLKLQKSQNGKLNIDQTQKIFQYKKTHINHLIPTTNYKIPQKIIFPIIKCKPFRTNIEWWHYLALEIKYDQQSKSIPLETMYNSYKQDQTKLKISAEAWFLYDYRKSTYKRGWKPAEVGDFSGLIRMLILRVYIYLQHADPEISTVWFRVNNIYLKEQISLAEIKKLPPSRRPGIIIADAISRVFDNNMSINVVDMLYGLFMSFYDDIIEYAIVFFGYLCYCHLNKTTPPKSVYIQTVQDAIFYTKYLAQFTNGYLFPSLQIQDSQFNPQNYQLLASSNSMCILFLSLEGNQLYKSIIRCNDLQCKIRYQLGYNFWENRVLKFKNKRISLGNQYQFVGNWRGKRYYSAICKNTQLRILMILRQCRFGMLELDVKCIENWVQELRKPVAQSKKSPSKLLPILRLSDHEDIKLKRSNTEA